MQKLTEWAVQRLKGISKCTGFVSVALLIVVGQFLIVQFGGDVFRTEPISLHDWLLIIGATSMVLWIGEAVRLLRSAGARTRAKSSPHMKK